MATRGDTVRHANSESLASPSGSGARVPASPSKSKRRTLTAKSIHSLPPGDYTDHVVKGLTLRVRTTGRRWAVRYRAKRGKGRGPQRRLHFGELGGSVTLDLTAIHLGDFTPPAALTLEGARDMARALLGLAARGVDPLDALDAADKATRRREAQEARAEQEATRTLGALLDRFLDERAEELRPSTLTGWRGLARGALAPLLDCDPAAVTARDLRRWHAAIGSTGRRVTANRALELLSALYSWGMKREDESGEPLLSASPCASVDSYAEKVRTRVLDSDEIQAVWAALEGEPFGDTVRLLFWTGARKMEALGAEWREVDFRARLWRVPAERSKTGEPRSIPLSKPALEMLSRRREADPGGRWIFPSPVGHVGPVRSIQAPVRRAKERSGVDNWTVHDLRRVVRTNLSALAVQPSVAEFILGHLAPRMVRTYDRHEPLAEAAEALEAWATRLDSIVTQEGGTTVVAFRSEG